jgi:hypothetical protein
MKSFLKDLKEKLVENDEFGAKSEEQFLANFKEEFGAKNSLWDSFQIKHMLAACVLVVALVSVYSFQDQKVGEDALASLQIAEDEVMLSNLELMEELEQFEDLSDEDWEILIGDAS